MSRAMLFSLGTRLPAWRHHNNLCWAFVSVMMVRFTCILLWFFARFIPKHFPAILLLVLQREMLANLSREIMFPGLLTSNTSMEQRGNKVTSGARHTTITQSCWNDSLTPTKLLHLIKQLMNYIFYPGLLQMELYVPPPDFICAMEYA